MTPQEVKEELKKLPGKLAKPIIVSLIISAIFIAYLLLVGIPKSQARNTYNHGKALLSRGLVNDGRLLIEEAYSVFPEEYIRLELESLEELFGT